MYEKNEEDLDVLMVYLKRRYNGNKNWLNITTGSPGSGKSYVDLRTCELWYKFWFNEPFPIENCCFSIEDIMRRLTDEKNRVGEMFILEEAGTLINSKDFQSKINKLFNFYMQSFRCNNTGLMFNLPLMSMLDKATRLLCHTHFITSKIIKTKKVCHIKPFFLQLNQDSGKVYRKFLRKFVSKEEYGFRYPVKVMAFGLPSKELRRQYEKKKADFVNKLGQNVLETIEGMKEKTDARVIGNTITARMKHINYCFHVLKLGNQKKIAEAVSKIEGVDITHQQISLDMRKMNRYHPKWAENPKEIGFSSLTS